jgi:hypothetical protein
MAGVNKHEGKHKDFHHIPPLQIPFTGVMFLAKTRDFDPTGRYIIRPPPISFQMLTIKKPQSKQLPVILSLLILGMM